MPYQPFKKETYNCAGGINTKISLYLAKDGEFLNLQNVDFRVIGALSSFAGTTAQTTVSTSTPISGIFGYYNGNSFSLVGTDYSKVFDAKSGSVATLLPFIYGSTYTATLTDPRTIAVYGGTGLYGTNGYDIWSFFGGSCGFQFSLPQPTFNFTGAIALPLAVSSWGGGSGGLSGILTMYYALMRNDGFVGPALTVTYAVTGTTGIAFTRPKMPMLDFGPSLAGGLSFGSWNLSGIVAWASLNGGVPMGFGGTNAAGAQTLAPLGMTTGTDPVIALGFAYTSTTVGAGGDWNVTTNPPDQFYGSFLYPPAAYGYNGAPSVRYSRTNFEGQFAPKLMALFANSLFTGNHYGYPSRLIFSDLGTPEKASPENFIDVGLENPTGLTALLPFFTQLMIFKQRGIWALSGTSINDFLLTQISPAYGCLGKYALCMWDNFLWFLDEKGVYEFNGSNIVCVSDKMEPYFRRMNVSAAASSAIMTHVKSRNEIWCAFPIDGSTFNNIILVYDYVSQGWTVRTAPPGDLSALSPINPGAARAIVYYGASGLIRSFGSSFVGDNGQSATQVIKSRFIEGDMGNSVTKQWRRLYVDAAIPTGMTYWVDVNIYADKASLPTYQTTMALTAYQNRIDFGVPAKSVAVEIVYNGATYFQLNGFTLEYRFQRAT